MHADILTYLSEITEEEQYNLVETNAFDRSRYAKPGRFVIERRRMSNLTFGEATAPICIKAHARFREFPAHSHDFIELMYVCSGSITHVVGTQTITLGSDEMILLGRDTKHSILKTGQNDIGINFIIATDLFESLFYSMRRNSYLSGQALEGLLRKNGTPFLLFSAKQSIAVRNLMESIIATVICEKNTDGYLLQQSMALLISHLASMGQKETTPTDSPKENMKKQLLNYLRTTYSTATLTEAANMFGLSASYFSRWVCENMGESFKELLLRERFCAACELLCTTNIAIGDIITQIGYENSSYFHKEFRQRYEMTPYQYRSKHKKLP